MDFVVQKSKAFLGVEWAKFSQRENLNTPLSQNKHLLLQIKGVAEHK